MFSYLRTRKNQINFKIFEINTYNRKEVERKMNYGGYSMTRKIVVVSEETHEKLKELSKKYGIKLNKIVELAIKDLEKKMKLTLE